jgi:hypothetical protein
LAERWSDDETRRLLQQRAVDDVDYDPRRAALQALVERWADDETIKMLRNRMIEAPEPNDRGVACSGLSGMHSQLGKIVFTRDLDGTSPYLDPLEPITRDHIEKAAGRAGIKPERIDEEVASLSAFLGWDITIGAGK